MQNADEVVFYGQPTHSDEKFMLSWSTEDSLESVTTLDSTRSDAGSAPPFGEILQSIAGQLARLLDKSERRLPTEWSMPDLVRAVTSEDFSTLTRDFYDLQANGTHSWLWEDFVNLLDLIGYVF
jgi:hypothetical protein